MGLLWRRWCLHNSLLKPHKAYSSPKCSASCAIARLDRRFECLFWIDSCQRDCRQRRIDLDLTETNCSVLDLDPYNLAHLLHDEQKVHIRGRHRSNIRDDGYNLALQAVQELLQFALIPGHPNVKSVNSISHLFGSHLESGRSVHLSARTGPGETPGGQPVVPLRRCLTPTE